jgi:predicted RNA-binding protein with RPS1 domain
VELPGFRKQGLVHHSQVSADLVFGRDDDDGLKVQALEFFLPRGERVWVKVVDVRTDGVNAKIACSMRAVDQETGTDLDPDNALAAGPGGRAMASQGGLSAPPELNSIHRATVQTVRPFGAFVQMEGFRKYGLVHFSQISDHMAFQKEDGDAERVAAISEVVAPGEQVWVKVVEVGQDERGPKVGCSIKLASQRDGADLDPHHTKYRPRGEGGGGGGGGGFGVSPRVEAVPRVACRCIPLRLVLHACALPSTLTVCLCGSGLFFFLLRRGRSPFLRPPRAWRRTWSWTGGT